VAVSERDEFVVAGFKSWRRAHRLVAQINSYLEAHHAVTNS
jgi:hypothetical protein